MIRILTLAARWPALAAWCLLLTAIVYGSTLRLPFYFDDYVHLPFVDTHSLAEIWQTAGLLAYYRPLPFSIWKVLALVTGEHSVILHRGLNLLLHAANGLLVAGLATAMSPATGSRWITRYLAGTLFILFPFSYQAVPWAGALSQLLVTFLVLVACVAYLHAQRGASRAWYGVSIAATIVAPFAHENGIIIGPLILLIELARKQRRTAIKTALLRAAVWTLPALLWLPIRLWLPAGPSSLITPRNLETIGQNTLYFLQGLAYPLTWLGGWLLDAAIANDLALVLLLSALALIPAAVLILYKRDFWALCFPLAWFLLASLPAILFLPFDYIINGPRLLLLPAVGVVLLWTNAATALLELRESRRLMPAVVAVLVVILLAQNGLFIRERNHLNHLLGDLYIALGETTATDDRAGYRAVVFNLPSWLAPGRQTYPLGHEGVLFWPDYAFPELLVRLQTGRSAAFLPVRVDALRSEQPFFYGLAGQPPDWSQITEAPARFYHAAPGDGDYRLPSVGVLRPDPPAPFPEPRASFAPAGNTDAILVAASAQEDETGITIASEWRLVHPLPAQVTVFAHVLDAGGQLIGQADGDFLGGALPLHQWPAGQTIMDRRQVPVTEPAAFVALGLYQRADGQRIPAFDPAGAPLPDQALVIPVQK